MASLTTSVIATALVITWIGLVSGRAREATSLPLLESDRADPRDAREEPAGGERAFGRPAIEAVRDGRADDGDDHGCGRADRHSDHAVADASPSDSGGWIRTSIHGSKVRCPALRRRRRVERRS